MKAKEQFEPAHIIIGTVIHGRGIGKLVGTPTVNLKVEGVQKLPQVGVYAAKIYINKQTYYGATIVGTHPTIDNDKDISIETFILNFDEEIYGSIIKIELYKKLRGVQRFDNLSLLLEQIKKDCLCVQELWGVQLISSKISICFESHNVSIDNQNIYLSKKEFEVLYLLYSNPGICFTKEQIYEAVWHEPAYSCFHAVENTVFQIRKRLKPYSNGHDFIKTIIGYGYKFNAK